MITNLKTVFSCLIFTLLLAINSNAKNISTDSTGFSGDHFSLEGALSLFEDSESLEAFEKKLNSEENHVNNLDLNEDGAIDFIRVIDHMDEDVHAIVLQALISEKEAQDIAVIEIEKDGKESATLQIIGDEDVYGEQKIVEPFEMEVEQIGNGPSGEFKATRVVVNVWFWPSVRHVYGPRYRLYVSPWGWRSYPRYWKPWRPFAWRHHYTHRVYKPHFRVVHQHRVVRAHRFYTPNRRTSTVVRTRTTVVRNRRGNVVGVRKNTTKTVRNKNGKVVGKKKTTKVRRNGKRVKKKTTKKVRKRRG